MSQDAQLSRKEKKAQRDAERAAQLKNGKKRKRVEVEDRDKAQEGHELQQDVVPLHTQQKGDEDNTRRREAAALTPKKRKKTKQAAARNEGDDGQPDPSQKNKSRFIVFVGNLPYSATDVSLRSHFRKLEPFTLRHRTDPKTKKSKGFAFVEFENYDRMKTCLKLYHHSMFDPAKSEQGEPDEDGEEEIKDARMKRDKEKGGRRINVELTAGGGGKAEGRKEKIKVRNVRLEEQRKRRVESERKEKNRSENNRPVGRNAAGPAKKETDVEDPADGVDENAGMHPSRLARMKK